MYKRQRLTYERSMSYRIDMGQFCPFPLNAVLIALSLLYHRVIITSHNSAITKWVYCTCPTHDAFKSLFLSMRWQKSGKSSIVCYTLRITLCCYFCCLMWINNRYGKQKLLSWENILESFLVTRLKHLGACVWQGRKRVRETDRQTDRDIQTV